MNSDFDLVGKTITGIVATHGGAGMPQRIWMLQFSDGSHVEFVSPSARRRLIRSAGDRFQPSEQQPQQVLMDVNVA
jgi:hypothetical protein